MGLAGEVHHLTCHGGLLSAGSLRLFVFVVHDFKTSNCESQQPNYGYSGRWNLQTLWDFHEIERILNAVLTIC